MANRLHNKNRNICVPSLINSYFNKINQSTFTDDGEKVITKITERQREYSANTNFFGSTFSIDFKYRIMKKGQ